MCGSFFIKSYNFFANYILGFLILCNMNTKAKFLIIDTNDKLIAHAEAKCGGVCVINGLALGKYKLIQYAAPCGLRCGPVVCFELDRLGCTRLLDVPAGIYESKCFEMKEDINFCTCANVAIRVNNNVKKKKG